MILNPDEFYTAIAPNYWVSKVFGLLHLSFTEKTPQRKLVITPFKSLIGLCILRTVIFLAITGYIYRELEVLEFPENMTGVAVQIELYLGVMLTIIEFILAVILRKSDLKIIDMFIALDKSMSARGICISYKGIRRIAYYQVLAVVVMFLVSSVLQVLRDSQALLVINAGINIVNAVNFFMVYQYINVLLLLKQRFVWLNNAIENIGTKHNADEEVPTLQLTYVNENNKSNSLSLSPYVSKKYMKIHDLRNTIRNYGKIYNLLSDLASLINDSFGFYILICILTRFIMICTELIYFYKLFQNPNDGDGLAYISIVLNILMHAFKLLATVSAAGAASAAVSIT